MTIYLMSLDAFTKRVSHLKRSSYLMDYGLLREEHKCEKLGACLAGVGKTDADVISGVRSCGGGGERIEKITNEFKMGK